MPVVMVIWMSAHYFSNVGQTLMPWLVQEKQALYIEQLIVDTLI